MTLDGDVGDVGNDLIDLAGRVGEAGESFFKLLANSGSGVANKVDHDRLGWDFHVQFGRSDDWRAHHSLDTRPPEASCFVQVKATTRLIRSWSLSLSTWERLAKERRPVFFVVFMFEKDALERPLHGYIVHLGEELLGRALKALRNVPDEKVDELNHQTLPFTWGEADKLRELTGRELIAAIQRHVGSDIGDYEAKKAKLAKTLGYDKNRLRVSLRIPREYTDEEIAAFTLGLKEDLKIIITRSVERRFQIEKPALNGPKLGEAELRIPKLEPDMSRFAIFEGRSSSEKVRIPCTIYGGAAFARVLSPRQRGLRIVVDEGEITMIPRGDQQEVTLSYSLLVEGERIPLATVARRARVVKQLADPLGCQLWIEANGKVWPSALDLRGAEVGQSAIYAEVLLCATRLAAAVDLDTTVEVEPEKLLDQYMAILSATTKRSVTLRGGPVTDHGHSGTPGMALLPSQVTIGSHVITSVVGITGVVNVDPNKSFEVTGTPELLKSRTSTTELDTMEIRELWTAAMAEVNRRGVTNWFAPRGILEEGEAEEPSLPEHKG